jgi:peptide/nickel transport system substrate-binding protein
MKLHYARIFIFLLCLSACDHNENLLQKTASVASSKSKILHFAIAQAPLNLDPRYATDAASERVNRLLYQRLVDFDESKPVPSLASWRAVSAMRFQFTLKSPRALFHDGSRLTAQDVKATYESLMALKDSPHAAEFRHLDSIEVIDADNFLVNLNAADAQLPEKMIIGILPQHLIDAHHDFSHQPVGSGALKFVAWENALTLVRVRDGQLIQFVEVKDPTVRVLKLMRGEADILQGDLPPELVKYVSNQADLTVKSNQGVNFSYLGLNMQDPVLKQLKVRQAIAHAIDTNAIIQQMLVSQTRQAGAILPPEHFAGNQHLAPYPYSPAYAKQLLLEAGIQLPLKLVYKTSTDAQRVRIATILQAQMRQAGIELSIKSLDWGTFFEDVKQGNFQLYGLTWVGIKTPDIYTKAFHSAAIPPLGFNRGRFNSARVDQLLTEKNWQAATQLIHAELPYIPLWYEGQFIAAQKSLNIDVPSADGNWDALTTIHY